MTEKIQFRGRPAIGWVDALRILACFMVVLAHCCDGFVAQFDSDPTAFYAGVTIGSLMRASVPLFVMMTGVLLLPVPQTMTLSSFYRKRVGRIIPPLVFWSLALPPIAYLYFTGWGSHSVNPSVDMSAYTPEWLTNRLWSWVLNFNFDTTPLWYLYMLLGLYLIMPLIGSWLREASKKDIRNFLGVWFITLFLPYVKLFAPAIGYTGNYGNMDILGACDWNAFSTFYYVSGFIGYLVLAYYLKTYPLQWSASKLAMVFVPLFVVGYAITAGGFIWMQLHHPGDYAFLEIIWYFTGINVWMMTVAMFVAVQKINFKSRRWMSWLASLTFGIYLCHFFFVMVAYDLFDIACLPFAIRILLMAVSVFAVSALVTWALASNRLTRVLVR